MADVDSDTNEVNDLWISGPYWIEAVVSGTKLNFLARGTRCRIPVEALMRSICKVPPPPRRAGIRNVQLAALHPVESGLEVPSWKTM